MTKRASEDILFFFSGELFLVLYVTPLEQSANMPELRFHISAPSRPSRPSRLFRPDNPPLKKNSPSKCHCLRQTCFSYNCVVAATAVCLILSVTLTGIFLSNSDLLVRHYECEHDKDCCSQNLPRVYGIDAQCLVSNNATGICTKENKCDYPEPEHKLDGSPCDDFQFCTVADQCFKGQCVATPRQCSDADWCTEETCSESLKSCTRKIGMSADDHCDTLCEDDEDCRNEYFCLPSKQCGKFPKSNTSLFFVGAELVPCTDTAYGYSMVQHYAIYSEAYEKDGHTRYRKIASAGDIRLPASGTTDALSQVTQAPDGVPLKDLTYLSTTQFHEATSSTPAYSETMFTARTVCQNLFDDEFCLSAWVHRRYDMQFFMTDCLVSGKQCLPSKLPTAASMSLSYIMCPYGQTAELEPLGSLRIEYPSKPGEVLTRVDSGEHVRAVLELQEGNSMDPFMRSAVVCGVDPSHRLAACAKNEEKQNCPTRGCLGWDEKDTPITFVRHYVDKGEATVTAALDNIVFCRGKHSFGKTCEASRCAWSSLSDRTPLGGAEGFQFPVFADSGTIMVVDLGYEIDLCGHRRRLDVLQQQNRGVAVLTVS